MRLNIKGVYFLSLKQLKEYISCPIDYNSIEYSELLGAGRHELSGWLRERGEEDLAGQIETIDHNLSDSLFFAEMKRILLGEEICVLSKPDFLHCYNVENVRYEVTDRDAMVTVSLETLLSVNEKFEIRVQTNWGTRGCSITPYDSKVGKMVEMKFHFRKRPNKELGEIKLFVDDALIYNCDSSIDQDNKKQFQIKDVYFNMIHVIRGKFMMKVDERFQKDGSPMREVIFSKDYYIGETQVTQGLWKAVMGNNPSYFEGDDLPVENVSWRDCREFICKINELTGEKFRLPTEAEWEFAARGGNKSNHTRYSGSDRIDNVAWYGGNSKGRTHPVASKHPNELGIYDMSGNVGELCRDWYKDSLTADWYHHWYKFYNGDKNNIPARPSKSDRFWALGGNWKEKNTCLLSVIGRAIVPDLNFSDNTIGFRLCFSE